MKIKKTGVVPIRKDDAVVESPSCLYSYLTMILVLLHFVAYDEGTVTRLLFGMLLVVALFLWCSHCHCHRRRSPLRNGTRYTLKSNKSDIILPCVFSTKNSNF